MIIMAISSLYLLGWLGVEGNENRMIFVLGAIGGISIGFAFLINATMLVRTRNEQHRNITVELPTKERSVRAISSGQVEEGMFMGAFV